MPALILDLNNKLVGMKLAFAGTTLQKLSLS